MNRYLMKFLSRAVYMAPLDDQAAGAGGAADRGDTLSAGAPDTAAADQAAADAAAEAERIRAEAEAAEAAKTAAGEAGGAGEGEGEGDGKKAAMIPVERHKAVLDKTRAERDALAAQVAQYQKGQQVVQTNADITKLEEQVTAKEAEYNKALVEGEVDKATGLMRDIRKLEREMGDMKAEMRAQAATVQAVESVRYNTAVERLESAYPALNPDHEDFDKDAVADVMDLKETYQRRGATPTDALQRAVAKLMTPASAKQEAATSVTPRVDKAALAAAERKESATAKAVDAATKTPPSTAAVGLDSDKRGAGALDPKDVMKMSQDQFRKLDEKTLAQLRGDEM